MWVARRKKRLKKKRNFVEMAKITKRDLEKVNQAIRSTAFKLIFVG